MNLALSIAVIIPSPLPLPWGVADGGPAPALLWQMIVAGPFVRIHQRTGLGLVDHPGLQGLLVGVLYHLPPHLARLPPNDPNDRWTVVVHGPVPADLVGPPPRRILRVLVGHSFLAGILVHLIGFDHPV